MTALPAPDTRILSISNEVIAEILKPARQSWPKLIIGNGTGDLPGAGELSTLPAVIADETLMTLTTAFINGWATWRHLLMAETSAAFAQSDLELLRAALLDVAATAQQCIAALDEQAEQIRLKPNGGGGPASAERVE